MKLECVRFHNFRQFAKNGRFDICTDGRITLIYGMNGDGKTTLHQLMEWILYGEAHFNKTTNAKKLYNNKIANDLPADRIMLTWGEIDFEHDGVEYQVRREWAYYKNAQGKISRKSDKDSFYVQKLKGVTWVDVDSPELVIEEALPSGLSQYFFFDGETMISDLKVKGSESAKALKTALYSIFDLSIYQKALADIGTKNKKSTALGALNAEMARSASGADDATVRKTALEMQYYNNQIAADTDRKKSKSDRLDYCKNRQIELSEIIGSKVSRKELEEKRRRLVKEADSFEPLKDTVYKDFGREVAANYPYLLLSRLSEDAGACLSRQAENERIEITPGLSKQLLISLINEVRHEPNNTQCICGRCIGVKELSTLIELKQKFPPTSYEATYQKYLRSAAKYSGHYNENMVEEYLQRYFYLNQLQKAKEKEIDEIDEQLKNSGDVDDLISERKEIGNEIKSLEKELEDITGLIARNTRQRELRKEKLAKIDKIKETISKYEFCIDLLDQVSKFLKLELTNKTKEYSLKLQKEIQYLLDEMLTSRRDVVFSTEFQLQVLDTYKDESKSEGQFAVVSFAYIGGILKVLSEHEKLKNKEYPLVLDGPFSKLDPEQKRNVIRTIPRYAKQIVLFSKDPLQDFFESDDVGKTYTIVSNDEKNNAEVMEGYLWK